nr:unnamed protein product [Digitaria exilis]
MPLAWASAGRSRESRQGQAGAYHSRDGVNHGNSKEVWWHNKAEQIKGPAGGVLWLSTEVPQGRVGSVAVRRSRTNQGDDGQCPRTEGGDAVGQSRERGGVAKQSRSRGRRTVSSGGAWWHDGAEQIRGFATGVLGAEQFRQQGRSSMEAWRSRAK